MNNTIETISGIDVVIESIKNDLYDYLSAKWGCSIDAYGRIYRNIDQEGNVMPEWYFNYNEYKDVMYNDQFASSFMFIDDETHNTEDEILFTSDVKCVFMVDLSRILPNELGRADAKAQKDVIEFLRNNATNRFTITSLEKGVRNVFRGFDTSKIKFSDIHPYHCFSVNVNLSYYIEDSCI
tara:strand:+ start:7329 stop:7871 length:543 start_codon:yes stop_codon:yes gene_type:complete